MAVTYILKYGQGLRRDIKYKWLKDEGKQNLRRCIRWRNIKANKLLTSFNAETYVDKATLGKYEYPFFVVTDSDFTIKNESNIVISEDLSSLLSDGKLANTEIGVHDTSDNMWINFWTVPEEKDSLVEHESSFDVTYTNNNPTVDGYIYKQIVDGGSYSDYDKWSHIYSGVNLLWGGRRNLVVGYHWERAYIQWNIAGLPHNITVTDVDVTLDGNTAPATNSEVRIPASKPSARTVAQKYDDIGSGTLTFQSTSMPGSGSNTYDLGANAVAEVQDRITNGDWFAIGFKLATETGTTNRHSMDAEEGAVAPILIVEYVIINIEGTELGEGEYGEGEIG